MKAQECGTTKQCSQCGEVKPLDKFYFRKGRGTYNSKCKDCQLAIQRKSYQVIKPEKLKKCAEYRKANKTKIKGYMAQWYEVNKEHVSNRMKIYRTLPEVKMRETERQRKYYADNREEIINRRFEYYGNNPEASKAKVEYGREHYLLNKDMYAAKETKRRTLKLSAMPSWANESKIKKIYLEARKLTNLTGVPHEVDHIIPLMGKKVCGLHVETNLQILNRKANRSKANKFG